jgi:hypothetical protein
MADCWVKDSSISKMPGHSDFNMYQERLHEAVLTYVTCHQVLTCAFIPVFSRQPRSTSAASTDSKKQIRDLMVDKA